MGDRHLVMGRDDAPEQGIARYREATVSVDVNTVKHMAKIAMIAVERDELESLTEDLNAILGFVETLQKVDTSGAELMTNVHGFALRMREDRVTQTDQRSEILVNAPEVQDDCYQVPRVME